MLTDKNVVVFGGTGSLGKLLVKRLLAGECGKPKKLLIVSRDEAKQHFMRLEFQQLAVATDELFYRNYERVLQFHIGDIRDYSSVRTAIRDADVVFNAAALKQVPACEYFPYEAVLTNIVGAENIARAIRENSLNVHTVIGVSTDKACKPVNVMGMTKAIQERIYGRANLDCENTRFACVRYGNVLASRGSVIPLFHEQIACGGPVTITTETMTRFLLPLDHAVDTIFACLKGSRPGEIYVPKCPAANIRDLAEVMVGDSGIEIKVIGIRPGEKEHEALVSDEESHRTTERDGYYVVQPILPELQHGEFTPADISGAEYDSRKDLMNKKQIRELLEANDLLRPHAIAV
ncbi:MAG TPA: polysaccharide biosynthesis protein, partial [Candidatus Melainabacteria bacterium]|nr:polysaccharide biosynthesis protein [Candidatus Melainabacteria bacterium]